MRQKESRRPSMRRLLFDPTAAERYPLADPNDPRVEANMIDLGASLPLLARAIVICSGWYRTDPHSALQSSRAPHLSRLSLDSCCVGYCYGALSVVGHSRE